MDIFNRQYKKLKQTKRIISSRISNKLRRPQFSKNPIPRRKGLKRPAYGPVKGDTTGEILLGSATAGPTGDLMDMESATLRTSGHMNVSILKNIRERAEETKKAEKEST